MGSISYRIRRLEQEFPPRQRPGDVDIKQALNLRVAGLLRCVVQARVMLILDNLANRKGCPSDVQAECRAQILEVIPAFEHELLRNRDDPRRQTCRDELEAAKTLVRNYAANAPFGSADQRGPTNR